MRKRDQQFVQALLERVAAGNELTDDVLIDAYSTSHCMPYGADPNYSPTLRRFALGAVKQKLRKPDIREALRDVYEVAGFDLIEGLELQLKHVRGELEKEVIKDGVRYKVKMPPNYAALRDIQKLIMPQPATKVEVAGKHMHAHVTLGGPSPAIIPRSIADTATIEQVQDDEPD